MPEVSVLVLVTSADGLERTVRSVVRQTFGDFELLVSAGPSVGDRILGALPDDRRIVVIEGSGDAYGALLDSALGRASGSSIMILTPGDELDREALTVLVERARQGTYDIVQGGVVNVAPDGSKRRLRLQSITGRYEAPATPPVDRWVSSMPVAVWGALYRRQFVLDRGVRIPEGLDVVQGQLFWHVVALNAAESVYLVDFPATVRSSPDRDGMPYGEGTTPRLAEAYAEVGERLRSWDPAVVADLALHELITIARRPDLVHRGREVGLAVRTIGEALPSSTALTGDPRFDRWALELRSSAPRPLRQIGAATLRSRLRMAGRRWAIRASRTIAKVDPRDLAGRLIEWGRQSTFSRGGDAPIPSIPQPQGYTGRNALVVVPWSDENGSTRIIDALDAALVDLGYHLHVVVYNDLGANRPRPTWEQHVFYDIPHSAQFGQLHYRNGAILPDDLGIDDWVGDDLRQFVLAADRAWEFDVVVCHYVFFSEVLALVNPRATRILVAHDRFSGRNSRLAERGMEDSFFFSTDPEQESIGLRRADHVISLQDAEAEQFRSAVAGSPTTVHSLPLLDPPRFLAPRTRSRRLIVGYLGSNYLNNRRSILDFFDAARERDFGDLEFMIGGRVCETLRRDRLPSQVTMIGRVDQLEDFYGSVDVVFNPDFLASGRKIKVFEGLSFGRPVITTAPATDGFDFLPSDLRLGSNEEILDRLLELAASGDALAEARHQAQSAYVALVDRTSTLEALATMVATRDDRDEAVN